MPEQGAGDFWAFSLAFYARRGVAETCLALQDRDGLDVNILLLCCWHGWSGRGPLPQDALARAEAAVAPWRSAVVEPLRAVRRALRAMPAAGAAELRREVQRLELAAEREAQLLLVGALPGTVAPTSADGLADAADNLATYLALRGRDAALAAPLVAALREHG